MRGSNLKIRSDEQWERLNDLLLETAAEGTNEFDSCTTTSVNIRALQVPTDVFLGVILEQLHVFPFIDERKQIIKINNYQRTIV